MGDLTREELIKRETFRLLTDPESEPVLKAMLDVRGRAASTFTPEFSGQRFSDYDRGLMDAFNAAQRATIEALAGLPERVNREKIVECIRDAADRGFEAGSRGEARFRFNDIIARADALLSAAPKP